MRRRAASERRAAGPEDSSGALHVLQHTVASCTACPGMKPWRQFPSEASGTARTGYLLVGEAPGYLSWKQGRRFIGPAGQLIRRALRRVDHPRYREMETLFYMTDVVKCHPAARANFSANRSPRRSEIRACAGYLRQEIAILRPTVVVTFGKTAEQAVTEAIEEGTALKSRVRLLVFPHPSPRNQKTILQAYPSMEAFERAVAHTFRRLIGKLEKGRRDA